MKANTDLTQMKPMQSVDGDEWPGIASNGPEPIGGAFLLVMGIMFSLSLIGLIIGIPCIIAGCKMMNSNNCWNVDLNQLSRAYNIYIYSNMQRSYDSVDETKAPIRKNDDVRDAVARGDYNICERISQNGGRRERWRKITMQEAESNMDVAPSWYMSGLKNAEDGQPEQIKDTARITTHDGRYVLKREQLIVNPDKASNGMRVFPSLYYMDMRYGARPSIAAIVIDPSTNRVKLMNNDDGPYGKLHSAMVTGIERGTWR